MKLGSEINEIHERTLEKINSKLILWSVKSTNL
jgi:hypothetical protein